MNANAQTGDSHVPSQAPPSSAPATPGIFDELSKLLTSARGTFSSFIDLVSLETRRAGLGLVWMLAGGLVAAVLVITAWAGLMAALALFIVSLGLHPITAIIIVTVINLLAAAGTLYGCFILSRSLLFPATRRQLAGAPAPLVSPAAS